MPEGSGAIQAPDKTIVLVGMMGAGKTSIGRRLARTLGWPFADADAEIELAAGTSIANIFSEIGEAAFRESEHQVIARLLRGERRVLALGGGAFIDGRTRATVRERALSVWLKADLDVLVQRTARRDDRPLLRGVDAKQKLAELLAIREPVYREADIIVDSSRGSMKELVHEILTRLTEPPPGAMA